MVLKSAWQVILVLVEDFPDQLHSIFGSDTTYYLGDGEHLRLSQHGLQLHSRKSDPEQLCGGHQATHDYV